MHLFQRFLGVLLLCIFLAALSLPAAPAAAAPSTAPGQLNVQTFLDGQPGKLKSYREGKYTAAQVIQNYTTYYNLDPRIILTLLELGPRLLTNANPAPEAISKPFGPAGPDGFTKQIDWGVREIRAGFGPYTTAPTITFTDGTTATLDVKQEPSIIAVQRFLAQGRTQAEWRALVDDYKPLHEKLWGDQPAEPTPTPSAARPFLKLPWPAGIEMIHTSYFDHVYPAVDRGGDNNSFIVDYLGRGNLSYNTHDGHDFYFPQKPIGTPILAASAGTAYAFSSPGNGIVVRMGGQYAGYEIVYWHLDQFAAIFQGKIDNGIGVPIETGTLLGTSGKTGFTVGGGHLHFEVRHNGKQVDPYGWFGPGTDPCAAWIAGCEASVWLWDDSLSGTYDFTRPDSPAPKDTESPVGNLAVAPDRDLGLLVNFDGNLVPSIGRGFPQVNSAAGIKPTFEEGVFGQALAAPNAVEVTYPISGNVELERGTISFWAKLPAEYPKSSTGRNYLFAASANPEDGKVYTNTLALRREQSNSGPQWNLWTVDDAGAANNLVVSDTLADGWHYFAVAWDRELGQKALYIDGELRAQATSLTLPSALGERLQLGRFIAGFGASGATFDDLAIFKRSLNQREIKRLADKQDVYTGKPGPINTAQVVTERSVLLDANAIDAQGGIVSVQLKRDDEPWTAPQPYYDTYRWTITGTEGLHTFAIKYRDRADNETVVTTTLELVQPLTGDATVRSTVDTAAVFGLAVGGIDMPAEQVDEPQTWLAERVQMQISTSEDFRNAVWEPFVDVRVWNWSPDEQRIVYVRFRDERGRISAPLKVGPDAAKP